MHAIMEFDLSSILNPLKESAFKPGNAFRLKPLPFAAAALLAVEMKRLFNRPIAVITECATLMEEMRRNLAAFVDDGNDAIYDFPSLGDIMPEDRREIDQVIAGERLRTLANVGRHPASFLLNTCVQALMQKTVSPACIESESLRLISGVELPPERLVEWLEKSAYEFMAEVQEKG